jgi:hypothetical protein
MSCKVLLGALFWLPTGRLITSDLSAMNKATSAGRSIFNDLNFDIAAGSTEVGKPRAAGNGTTLKSGQRVTNDAKISRDTLVQLFFLSSSG